MVKHISRRSTAILAGALILVAAAGAVTAAPLLGLFSTRPHQTPLPMQGASSHVQGSSSQAATTPRGTGPASVQLVTQDLTPNSHLTVTGGGFGGGEQVSVTIEDALGHPYERVTLLAGADGRLRATSLALPPQLGAGDYRLLAVGNASHRKASVAFRMHDTPPAVTLDAYTSKPGAGIAFAGSGFIPGETVNVYLGTSKVSLASLQATDRGAVNGRLEVPALPAGNYMLTFVGKSGQTPISMGFNIQGFAAWVVLSRYMLTSGEGLGFTGQGFSPGEQVFVYLNAPRGTPAMRLTADSSGRVVAQDTWVPSGVSGQNTLMLAGRSSGATAKAEFTIEPAAQPTPTAPAP
jgi:hypothetical protein